MQTLLSKLEARIGQGKRVTVELQRHSDQGFQYASQAYFSLTQEHSIMLPVQDAEIHMTML